MLFGFVLFDRGFRSLLSFIYIQHYLTHTRNNGKTVAYSIFTVSIYIYLLTVPLALDRGPTVKQLSYFYRGSASGGSPPVI